MATADYYKYFKNRKFDVGDGVTINTYIDGKGDEAVLLLHGHPESAVMWRFIAPKLAENYVVVVPDLRGYGESSKPEGEADHSTYSKRRMARDNALIMEKLGFDKYHIAGHDRGARVCHRYVLDYPERVKSCTLLDIISTYDTYAKTDRAFATKYWHWFYYIQPDGLPEKTLSADPDFFIRFNLTRKIGPAGRKNFPEDVLAEYIKYYTPDCVHAIAEDYKAAATIDLEHDAPDREKKFDTPLLVLWGANGVVGSLYDVIECWKPLASNVEGFAVQECGHFVPEEQPEVVLKAMRAFLEKNK